MHAVTLRRALFKKRRRMLAEKVERYRTYDRETIERMQVTQFNAVWSYCLGDVPFYRSWPGSTTCRTTSIGRRISQRFQRSRSG